MLHEMITGQPPFEGEGVVILAQQVNAQPPPLTSPHGPIDPAVTALVARLLAKQPAIDNIAPPADARVASSSRRKIPRAALIAVAAVLVLVGAGLAIRTLTSGDGDAASRSGRRPSDEPAAAKPAPKTPPSANISGDGSKGFSGKVGSVF